MIKTGIGSQVLGRWVPIARQAWYKKYHEPLFLIETMVEPPHTGIVYKAASWLEVGMTSGTTFKRKMSRALLRQALVNDTGAHAERAKIILESGYEAYGWKQVVASPT